MQSYPVHFILINLSRKTVYNETDTVSLLAKRTQLIVECIRLEYRFSSVQSLSHARLFVTPWTAARQASLSFTISQKLLKLMSIESVMPSNHLVLCHTFSSCLRSFPASGSFPRSVFFASGAQVLNLQLQHQSFQ